MVFDDKTAQRLRKGEPVPRKDGLQFAADAKLSYRENELLRRMLKHRAKPSAGDSELAELLVTFLVLAVGGIGVGVFILFGGAM